MFIARLETKNFFIKSSGVILKKTLLLLAEARVLGILMSLSVGIQMFWEVDLVRLR